MANRKRLPTVMCRGYPDTVVVHLFCKQLMTIERCRLRDLYGDFCDAPIKAGEAFKTRIAVQCPQRAMLDLLDELLGKYGGHITRIDIAFEARPSSLRSPTQQMAIIQQSLILKHRQPGPIKMHRNEGYPGFNFIPAAHVRRIACDVAGYWDLKSKLNADECPARFELRLRGTRGFGRPRYGEISPSAIVTSLHELADCDIGALAKRHIKFVAYDMRDFKRRLFAGQDADQITHIMKCWRLSEYQFQFAQRVHDYDPRLPMIETDHVVGLPSRIAWGARRRGERRFAKSVDED